VFLSCRTIALKRYKFGQGNRAARVSKRSLCQQGKKFRTPWRSWLGSS